MPYTKDFINGNVFETLKVLNHLANALPTEKLILEVNSATKLIKEASEQGDMERASILTYWRSLFFEALERRNKFAYHCWMAMVLDNATDPTPYFIRPEKEGQTSKNDAGPEDTQGICSLQENCPDSITRECP